MKSHHVFRRLIFPDLCKCLLILSSPVAGTESAWHKNLPLVGKPSDLSQPSPELRQLLQRRGGDLSGGLGVNAAGGHDHLGPRRRRLSLRTSHGTLLHVPSPSRHGALQRHDFQVDFTYIFPLCDVM